MKNKILLLVFAGFLISLACAQVPTFHQFYGNVVDTENNLITEELVLTSYINTMFSDMSYVGDGEYGYAEPYFVEYDTDYDGEEVYFYLNGHFAESHVFEEEGLTNLNLTYNTSSALVCFDSDGDSYNVSGGDCGVVDCNDLNENINQGATEICNDGIDNDCDGKIDSNDGDCATTISSSSSGSSGGGGAGGVVTTFDLDKTQVNLVLYRGENSQMEFTISDAGVGGSTIQINSDLDMISPTSIDLPFGGSVKVVLDINIPMDADLDIYTGHIDINCRGIQKQIAVSIAVISEGSLFDVFLEIPSNYLVVLPGDSLFANFSFIKLIEQDVGDVLVKYMIKDDYDNVVYSDEEYRTIGERDDFVKEFIIPENFDFGDYLLYSKLVYDDKTASASMWFDVGARKIDNFRIMLIVGILILTAIAILVVIVIHRSHSRVYEQKGASINS